jgi:hypothetical protein
MFYIHHITCISPQQTFTDIDLEKINNPAEKKLKVIEPSYKDVPVSVLRRMGKAVRIGMGTALPLIKTVSDVKGIVIGTANGGMEDCIKFLIQIIQYEEGTLTPTNFVQSTANNIASQAAMLSSNTGYNITHVHRGLAFENAVIDIEMLCSEIPGNKYILGGVDEISNYNYNIAFLDGLYKSEDITTEQLYLSNTPGSIAGEGAAMFVVSGQKQNSIAQLKSIKTIHTHDEKEVADQLAQFIKTNLNNGEEIDLFLSGENGDNRLQKYFQACEEVIGNTLTARFKHMSGEFPTASAFSLWFACNILQSQYLPQHTIKQFLEKKSYKNILIYNNHRGYQHSFMLVTK